jgi:hypothetical protein
MALTLAAHLRHNYPAFRPFEWLDRLSSNCRQHSRVLQLPDEDYVYQTQAFDQRFEIGDKVIEDGRFG